MAKPAQVLLRLVHRALVDEPELHDKLTRHVRTCTNCRCDANIVTEFSHMGNCTCTELNCSIWKHFVYCRKLVCYTCSESRHVYLTRTNRSSDSGLKLWQTRKQLTYMGQTLQMGLEKVKKDPSLKSDLDEAKRQFLVARNTYNEVCQDIGRQWLCAGVFQAPIFPPPQPITAPVKAAKIVESKPPVPPRISAAAPPAAPPAAPRDFTKMDWFGFETEYVEDAYQVLVDELLDFTQPVGEPSESLQWATTRGPTWEEGNVVDKTFVDAFGVKLANLSAYEFLSVTAQELLMDVMHEATSLARHRHSSQVEVRDVKFAIESRFPQFEFLLHSL